MSNKQITALFAGTFDPYTIGHHRIVQRALAMSDRIVIAIGRNVGKQTMLSIEERTEAIKKLYADEPRVEVTSYEGLTTDYAQSICATHLLRGVRSVKDFEYERDLADLNLRIGGVDTLLLISEPEYAAISSSVVRELMSYGKDISKLIP
ncbi:MAG: pantetheine-phosphate adenylyltransferase [Bacteroidaceae bacterium]|nr:pantetheine-phosphate adenylyltransferase [Bacteroidaceae bacterium]